MKFVVMDLEEDQLALHASSLAPIHRSNGVTENETGYKKPCSERTGKDSSLVVPSSVETDHIKSESEIGEELYRGFRKGLRDERAGAVWHGRSRLGKTSCVALP